MNIGPQGDGQCWGKLPLLPLILRHKLALDHRLLLLRAVLDVYVLDMLTGDGQIHHT